MCASKSILRAAAALIGVCGLNSIHAQTSEPYAALSNPGREVVNFNIETVRGMVMLDDELYALNTHGSRLVHFADLGVSTQTASWKTLHNPVALVSWDGPYGERLLVLGGATHALAIQNPLDGYIEGVLNLPSEPGDILVLNGHAYISCMGANVVVDVQLGSTPGSMTISGEYEIPSQRPRFLHEAGGRIFVAPFISGNNTTVQVATGPTSLAKVKQVPSPGLPDQDLFELLPGTSTVNPVLRGVGHLILDHARSADGDYYLLSIEPDNDNPEQTEAGITGRFAENTITKVGANRFPNQGGTIFAVQPSSKVDLDDGDRSMPGKQYSENHSCSFPFSIAIESVPLQQERIYVAGSTSDRVLIFDTDNQSPFDRIGKIDLLAGSIPRDLLITPVGLLVYQWGSNRMALFDTSQVLGDDDTDPETPIREFDLGIDPTPASVRAGRSIWYDARNSDDARSSCNTCHPGGSSDFLGWALSGDPADRKDVMVTQSLLSTEDTFPYHWRGERELRDFNREAFVGLLGADDPLDSTKFAQFQEFVFSLQAPRNPRQNAERTLTGNAIAGQTVFHNAITDGPFKCSRCHTLPTGSIGDMASDVPSLIPSNGQFDSASLRQLYNKDGGSTLVGSTQFPLLGWGISHDGDEFDVFDFLSGFTFTGTGREDVTAFVNVFDQGIAPAAQMAWHVEGQADPDVAAVQSYLLDQADQGWLDVCAFGETATQRVHWLYRPADGWFEADDASVDLGPTSPGLGLASFSNLQQFGANVFLGVPPVAGEVFALDHDNDGLNRGQELVAMTLVEDPDTDNDTFPDGYEVAHLISPTVFTDPSVMAGQDSSPPELAAGYPKLLGTTATSATYEVAFLEPATYVITADREGQERATRRRLDPVERDTIVIQGLKPSSSSVFLGTPPTQLYVPPTESAYSVTIRMTDIVGNVTNPIAVSEEAVAAEHLEPALEDGLFVNSLFAEQPLTLIVSGLELDDDSLSSGELDMEVIATIEPLHEGLGSLESWGFKEDKVIVAQILKKNFAGEWEIVPISQITEHSTLPVALSSTAPQYTLFTNFEPPDPDVFVDGLNDILYTAPTGQDGQATFALQVNGLVDGDQLRLNIVGIFVEAPPGTPGSPPVFNSASRLTWMMPLTQDDPMQKVAKSLRFVEVTYDAP